MSMYVDSISVLLFFIGFYAIIKVSDDKIKKGDYTNEEHNPASADFFCTPDGAGSGEGKSVMFAKDNRIHTACNKELSSILKQEAKHKKHAEKTPPQWKAALAEKVPTNLRAGLQTAFSKAFGVIFEKGTSVIDKTYNKAELVQNHQIQDYAVHLKGSRKELKRMRSMAAKSNFVNASITTAEGTALGALGIGMPDIVIFIGLLLKGVYESSLQYGYDYNEPKEKLLILKMLEAALSKTEDWVNTNAEVDRLLTADYVPAAEDIKAQIKRTADIFALDMLVFKFVQGLPVVGIIGGLANPVYYTKILKYIQMKYYKRYILKLCSMQKIH